MKEGEWWSDGGAEATLVPVGGGSIRALSNTYNTSNYCTDSGNHLRPAATESQGSSITVSDVTATVANNPAADTT